MAASVYELGSSIPVVFRYAGAQPADTVRITLIRVSDGQYWTGSGQAFQVAENLVTLAHLSSELFNVSFSTGTLGADYYVAWCEQTDEQQEFETRGTVAVSTSGYGIAKRDPVSRVRLLIPDTNMTSPIFDDDEILMALVEKEHAEFLYIYYATGFDASITAASVETRIGATSYEFKLKRSLEAMDLFSIGRDRQYDTVTELIRGVQALSKGYQIGTSLLGGDIEWLSLDFYYYPETYVSLGDLRNALYRRSRDLAPTEGVLNIYGADNMQRLSMINVNLAAAYLLRCILGDPSAFKTWRAQNVEWERPYEYIEKKIRRLEGMRMLGVKSLWSGTTLPDRPGYMIPPNRLPG